METLVLGLRYSTKVKALLNVAERCLYLSTPVASPCRAVCQCTGRNSTRLIKWSSRDFLKWLCSNFKDTLRKSSTVKTNTVWLKRNIFCKDSHRNSTTTTTIGLNYDFITDFELNFLKILSPNLCNIPHSTMLLNLRSQTGPMPCTINTRWSTWGISPRQEKHKFFNDSGM